ncbi:MAG: serine hydrolase domain-containing protein [Faecalibacterium sp.]
MEFEIVVQTLAQYQAKGYFPSAVCRVFRGQETLYECTLGDTTADTWYDLASVSKLMTTTLNLNLIGAGRFALDTPVLQLLPVQQMGAITQSRLAAVTVYQLMTHTSGLLAWYPFYADGAPFYAALEHALAGSKPEVQMVYSDLNYMLLGEIFRNQSGLSLPEGLAQYIKAPLDIADMGYGVAAQYPCAPSSYGNPIEQRMCAERGFAFDGWRSNDLPVCRTCNDGNAHYFWQDIAGHAGVFATAEALAKLGQFYLTTQKAIFVQATEELNQGRGIGFDKTDTFPAGCGHTGFTGTSLWVSRAHDIGAVILTNKFYQHETPPGSSNEFRRAVHEAILAQC